MHSKAKREKSLKGPIGLHEISLYDHIAQRQQSMTEALAQSLKAKMHTRRELLPKTPCTYLILDNNQFECSF